MVWFGDSILARRRDERRSIIHHGGNTVIAPRAGGYIGGDDRVRHDHWDGKRHRGGRGEDAHYDALYKDFDSWRSYKVHTVRYNRLKQGSGIDMIGAQSGRLAVIAFARRTNSINCMNGNAIIALTERKHR